MSTRVRERRLATAAVGLAAMAGALMAPAAAAHASAASYTPSPHQWYFSKWSVQQDVWPVTEGAGVTVAVLDSGVQASIPDLQGAVEPGGDMLGDAGNGEKDYTSGGGHGTAVAALIAGQGANGGPVGIAPQARILPVHVDEPSTSTTPVAAGIKYAVNRGAQVINLSLGTYAPSATTCDPNLQEAVDYALAHDVVVVAAAGDTNLGGSGPEEPASCAGVLAVGGVEPNGSLWADSTQGVNVSVAAPGDQLYTVSSDGQEYSYTSSGTSFSAPLVSGAAALIRSKYPAMPWYQVDQRLIDTAVHSGAVPNQGTGYGIIDINRALNVSQYPVSSAAPNPPYTRYNDLVKGSGKSGGGSAAQSGSGTGSSSPAKSGKSGTLLIVILVIVVIVIAAIVLIIVLATRGRNRRGPGNPGGGYPPGGYGGPGQPTAPSQYPQPGQPTAPGQYAPPGQYPQPGQYAPPGGQYPPGQYPPPVNPQYPPGPYPPGQQYPPPQP